MNFKDMLDPMSPIERTLRISTIIAFGATGYWAGGGIGMVSMLFFLGFGHGIFLIVHGGYNALKRDFGNDGRAPTVQVDQKVLNMNVEPGNAIKGQPVSAWHRDPTRPPLDGL